MASNGDADMRSTSQPPRRRSSLASVHSIKIGGGGEGRQAQAPIFGRSYYASSYMTPAIVGDGGGDSTAYVNTTPNAADIRLQTQMLAEHSSFDSSNANSALGRPPKRSNSLTTSPGMRKSTQPVPHEDETIQELSEPSSAASSLGGISKLLRMSPTEEQRRSAGRSTSRTDSVDHGNARKPVKMFIEQTPSPTDERSGLLLNGAQNGRYTTNEDAESQTPVWKTHPARSWRGIIGSMRGMRDRVALSKADVKGTAREAARSVPAVILGLLLNILDALSYGMILFPLGTPIFASLGPDGISMFYISCIVSQLVFSCGGSIFKGGIGSEMIEVVPFFHQMAFSIMNSIGEDQPEAVIATTIFAYAISSILTGLVFYLLGKFRLGALIGYFPRHILIGCIGGVGWFLFVTGLEVSARLDGNLEYNLPTFKHLIQTDTLPLWLVPLGLAVLLEILQRLIYHPLLVPVFFCLVPAIFYIVVSAVPSLQLEHLRSAGWVFEAPESGKAWYDFYSLYKIGSVHWGALLETVPAMFALTFFGILHVPINIPALGVSTAEDNVDVDRELKAHGVSNALSGLLGSIQNYLVYTNSILFIRSGGNSRIAGVMLAMGTAVIMGIGPSIIGYIPIMVVGALIFLLGMDLLKEALIDTIGKVDLVEYLTICVIVLVMGVFDFVLGIVAGIILACIFFVLQTAKRSPIRTRYSGVLATSTVRRPPAQQRFLREAGHQIQVYKLTGYLFFGSITYVEKVVREHVGETQFEQRPIRFLILDLTFANGMDFSAAEAFTRMHRLLSTRGIHLILCGVKPHGEISRGLRAVGLLQDGCSLKTFDDLNSALEWCENILLAEALKWTTKTVKSSQSLHPSPSFLEVPNSDNSLSLIDAQAHSPRGNMLMRAASSTLMPTVHATSEPRISNLAAPLPLLLTVFKDLTEKREDFWHRVSPYFKREEIASDKVLWDSGTQASCFYVLESGMIRASYEFEIGTLNENIAPGTVAGELPFLSETPRSARLVTAMHCVVWRFDRKALQELGASKGGAEIVTELYKIGLKLSSERLAAILSYGLTSS